MGFEIDNIIEDNQYYPDIATSGMKIGTITFIKPKTNEFVALGHSTLKEDKEKLAVFGSCYDIDFTGINKASMGITGSIVGYSDKSNEIGYIFYNSKRGIFGRVHEVNAEDYQEVETACWYDVKKDKANILMKLDGDELQSYEVEITDINYLNSNKNIRLKITDKELLEKTGGIVQGMSGTPIMQDREIDWCCKFCKLC